MKCRHCNFEIRKELINLGTSPYSNAYLSIDELETSEIYHPLKVMVCEDCWLVQTTDSSNEKSIFNDDYAYFSSTSTSWLKHSKNYVEMIVKKLQLSQKSFVVELASNDGYLLKNFQEKQIPSLGVEPTKSTAKASKKIGIEVIQDFFTEKLANVIIENYKKADLIIGNNVYAHVPNVNDFTSGIRRLLTKNGVVTLEFPHVLKLMQGNQFDTIYHEHYSYFSLLTVSKIFKNNGLKIWDVEEITTHGGSLRIYGCLEGSDIQINNRVDELLNAEIIFGLNKIETYDNFQKKAEIIKNDLLEFLIAQKKLGHKTVAYGAAAKGNTLLNYSGIKNDLVEYVVDGALSKQGKYMPGSRLPIHAPNYLLHSKPKNILILPWNISLEIKKEIVEMGLGDCRCIVAIPKLTTIN
jgi:SAM-dependent methyltransferase